MPEHLRHKPPNSLERPRELVLVCPDYRSKVNLARTIRLAGCAGIQTVYACGSGKIDPAIARDALNHVEIVRRRTQGPLISNLKSEGYRLIGLEQTDASESLFVYSFVRKTALVIGHERRGMESEVLAQMDDLIEIPVYGRPYSYNVVTATTMAVYEYCRQFPTG